MKRIVSLLVAAVFVLCLLPTGALATVPTTPVFTQDESNPPQTNGNAVRIHVKATSGAKKITNITAATTSGNFTVTQSTLPDSIEANSSGTYYIDAGINEYLPSGNYNFDLNVYYKLENDETDYINVVRGISIYKSTPQVSPDGNSLVAPEESVNDAPALILDPMVSIPVLTGKPGDTLNITLPLFNRSALTLLSVQMWPKISTDVEEYPFAIDNNNYVNNLGSIKTASRQNAKFRMKISDEATNGTKLVTFMMSYIENNAYCEFPLTIYVNVTGGRNSAEEGDDVTVPVVVAAKSAAGETVSTPTGDAGDKVTVVMPVKNRGEKTLSNIEIYPQLSADPASFPFEVGSASYERTIPKLKPGETKDISYSFRLSDKVTSGVKPVKYSVIYRDENGVTKQIELTTYVNVRKGYTGTEGGILGPDGETLVVQPKLIITSYQLPERTLAGTEFDLTVTVKNASDVDTVKNVKMTFSNSESVLLPAQGGSNTVFVRQLAPGEETVQTIRLQSIPDAASKSHMLDIKFDYNNASVNSFTSTETIAVPIKQELRVTVDEPQVYVEGATLGNSFYAFIQFYNKGKAQVYNVTLKLKSEGDTMRLEEGYYGGNMAPGSSSGADISILPLQAGDLFGAFVIQYEDEYGEVYEVEKEFTVYIQDNGGGEMGGEMMDPTMSGEMTDMYGGDMYGDVMGGDMGGGEGLPTWALIAICVGGAAVLVVAFILIRKNMKKKRDAELESE